MVFTLKMAVLSVLFCGYAEAASDRADRLAEEDAAPVSVVPATVLDKNRQNREVHVQFWTTRSPVSATSVEQISHSRFNGQWVPFDDSQVRKTGNYHSAWLRGRLSIEADEHGRTGNWWLAFRMPLKGVLDLYLIDAAGHKVMRSIKRSFSAGSKSLDLPYTFFNLNELSQQHFAGRLLNAGPFEFYVHISTEGVFLPEARVFGSAALQQFLFRKGAIQGTIYGVLGVLIFISLFAFVGSGQWHFLFALTSVALLAFCVVALNGHLWERDFGVLDFDRNRWGPLALFVLPALVFTVLGQFSRLRFNTKARFPWIDRALLFVVASGLWNTFLCFLVEYDFLTQVTGYLLALNTVIFVIVGFAVARAGVNGGKSYLFAALVLFGGFLLNQLSALGLVTVSIRAEDVVITGLLIFELILIVTALAGWKPDLSKTALSGRGDQSYDKEEEDLPVLDLIVPEFTDSQFHQNGEVGKADIYRDDSGESKESVEKLIDVNALIQEEKVRQAEMEQDVARIRQIDAHVLHEERASKFKVIDMTRALALAGGDEARLNRSLTRFHDRQRDAVDKISEACSAGDFAKSCAIIATLKEKAGGIAAEQLKESIARLNEQLELRMNRKAADGPESTPRSADQPVTGPESAIEGELVEAENALQLVISYIENLGVK